MDPVSLSRLTDPECNMFRSKCYNVDRSGEDSLKFLSNNQQANKKLKSLLKFTIQYHCNVPYFLKTHKFHRKTPSKVVPWSIIYFYTK